ncbi:hypothetical protein F4777DRAFT_223797 [Nemania sp. FL0916]|nr:hypothetical protein F4777DRAFT_223797 [Nemania sp. FL0916]
MREKQAEAQRREKSRWWVQGGGARALPGERIPRAFELRPLDHRLQRVNTWLDPALDWLCIEPWNRWFDHWDKKMSLGLGYASLGLTEAAENIAVLERDRTSEVTTWVVENIMTGVLFPKIQRLAIVREIITLHARPEQVWAGRLLHRGDTHVLIDVVDACRLSLFRYFYTKVATHQRLRTVGFLDALQHRDVREEYEDSMTKELQEGWLISQRSRLPDNEKHNIDIRLRQERLTTSPWDFRRQGAEYAVYVEPNEYSDRLLREHFPKITSMIMFRICTANECDQYPAIPSLLEHGSDSMHD